MSSKVVIENARICQHNKIPTFEQEIPSTSTADKQITSPIALYNVIFDRFAISNRDLLPSKPYYENLSL